MRGRTYVVEKERGEGIKGFRERVVRMGEGEKVRLRQRVVRLRGMAATTDAGERGITTKGRMKNGKEVMVA